MQNALKRYELTDGAGNVLTVFEFDLYGMGRWFAERSGELRAAIQRATKKLGNINPDGSGRTWLGELRIRKAERSIMRSFSSCPGNVEEAFFFDRRPFASVDGDFYLSKVLTIIYNILNTELEAAGGQENEQ